MKLCEEYIAYLKDNPEGYWFKRKLYGYGWTPAKPAGWIVLGVYLLVVFFLVLLVAPAVSESDQLVYIISPIIAASVIFLIVVCRTGESLKWQWGKELPKQ